MGATILKPLSRSRSKSGSRTGMSSRYTCKQAWGYPRPNFDPLKLSRLLQKTHPDWHFEKTFLYTGLHHQDVNPDLHHFWTEKFNLLKRSSQATCVTRPLRYTDCDGVKIAREKGIDVRIALDLVRLARAKVFDVAVIFSQDNDFREVADEIRDIAKELNYWIKIASAFPDAPGSNGYSPRGIDHTDWIPIPREDYDRCIDPNDYALPPITGKAE